jgi:general secretion pathway protein G
MVTSYMRRHRQTATRPSLGFTLIEMVIVIAIISILLSMAVANYRQSIQAARDASMKQNLFTLRHVIQEFTLDKQRAPQSLDELIQANYLKEIPIDPCTKQKDWRVDEEDTLLAVDQNQPGITDVHSICPLLSSDGITHYSDW